MGAVFGVVEVRQRRGIAGRSRKGCGAERRQGLRGDDPRRNRGAEILAEERAERLSFPALQVARRPVVEQAIAEDVVGCLADRDAAAELGWRADVDAELELEIEIARRAVAR